MTMNDSTTTLAELRTLLLAFREARDWAHYHRPRNLALALSIEVGELAEHFLWRTDDEIDAAVSEDPSFRTEVADEIADVMNYLLYMAEAMDVDVAAAVAAKVARNEARFPVGDAEPWRGKR